MDTHLSLSSLLITLSFFSTVTPPSHCLDDDQSFLACTRPYHCGNLTNISFPFWGGDRPQLCGHSDFKLWCRYDSYTVLKLEELEFRVLNINQSARSVTIARMDLSDIQSSCPRKFVNTALNHTLFEYDDPQTIQNLTLVYNCSSQVNSSEEKRFTCGSVGGDRYNYTYFLDEINHTEVAKCPSIIKVPILRQGGAALSGQDPPERGNQTLQRVLNEGFEVKYRFALSQRVCEECTKSGGSCGFNMSSSSGPFFCFCPGEVNSGMLCPRVESSTRLNWRLILTISLVGIAVLSFMIICSVKTRKSYLSNNSKVWWKRDAKNHHFTAEEILRNFGSMAPKQYSYSDVKKLTNSFKDKVGQGGYGVVYKGELHDGRIVAVKVLGECKDNGEEFINEVASISRTSHVNIVTLLGFCYGDTKRALIYEFMPNGSLDKFIHNKISSITKSQLDYKTMFKIALGIARGLEYLHRGCRTRILHFDIKPHNILLDEDLCPKISDFGLAKLCKTKDQSIVSMTGMRGTPGYIAPEVFCRYFGGVSHKSDVYSYGMLVLDMVGERKICVGSTSLFHSSEIYFPEYIYDKIEHSREGFSSTSEGIMSGPEEDDMLQKMMVVSLWCIQTNPSERPSMSKVIEMLEGSLQSLQLPPKPSVNSPTIILSPQHDSSTTL